MSKTFTKDRYLEDDAGNPGVFLRTGLWLIESVVSGGRPSTCLRSEWMCMAVLNMFRIVLAC